MPPKFNIAERVFLKLPPKVTTTARVWRSTTDRTTTPTPTPTLPRIHPSAPETRTGKLSILPKSTSQTTPTPNPPHPRPSSPEITTGTLSTIPKSTSHTSEKDGKSIDDGELADGEEGKNLKGVGEEGGRGEGDLWKRVVKERSAYGADVADVLAEMGVAGFNFEFDFGEGDDGKEKGKEKDKEKEKEKKREKEKKKEKKKKEK